MSAVISECGNYRYTLDRAWGPDLKLLLFIMLNPSKADAEQDDPTIRKNRGFSQRLGFDRFRAANLYGWRATDPRALSAYEVTDPVGEMNDFYLYESIRKAHIVIAAWGGHILPKRIKVPKADRVATVAKMMKGCGKPLYRLGMCNDGSPRHPLMLPYSTQPEEFIL